MLPDSAESYFFFGLVYYIKKSSSRMGHADVPYGSSNSKVVHIRCMLKKALFCFAYFFLFFSISGSHPPISLPPT